jgi:two-component system, sensor histidine kinase and response regulator
MIFDAFSQADSSTTRKFGGTGLGLAISARLASMMNGRIWVESEIDKGSAFHFTVRVGKAPANVVVKADHPVLASDAKILVVDDNFTNRRILTEILKRWNLRSVAVEDASAALVELEAAHNSHDPYVLLLTDGHMPEVDGFQLVERVRADGRFGRIPVIMLTSAIIGNSLKQARDLGIQCTLTKPARRAELRNALARVLPAPGGLANLSDAVSSVQAPRPRGVLQAEAGGGRQARVLLAEDNAINQRLIMELLKKRGHSVEMVANGVLALAALERGNFDLVLMDIQMPDMDGLQATAAIREREKQVGGHIPIIALTAHAMSGDSDRCLAAGMDAYLAKPINPRDLYSAIETAMAIRV